MCGIAGYFSRRPIETKRLESCLDLMSRRGPDDSGIYEFSAGPNVGLLHTRLAILDLDKRSAQPFKRGQYIFVFNGEIYNYLELRQELQSFGHHFETTGDTEVLAAAWIQWGKDALSRFDGMWSFAVFDTEEQLLTLSTDPFGEKPLFFHHADDGSFYFGSQVDCVLQLARKTARPNWEHLKRYLVNGYKSLNKTDNSFVDGIMRVPGNRTIEVDNDGIRFGNYWDPTTDNPPSTLSRSEHVEAVRAQLIETVTRRMRSDVPLAFCMSGGIDSNAIIAIAAKVLSMNVCGFTIVNEDGRYDERTLVDASSSELGVQNVKVKLEKRDFISSLTHMISQRSAPVATISYYSHHHLQNAIAANGYKVAISGTGADELFSGYYDHHLLYLASQFPSAAAKIEAIENWKSYVQPITRNPLLQDELLYQKAPSFRDHIYYKREEYAVFLKESWSDVFVEASYCPTLLRNRMMNELFHEAVPIILAEDDANAMAYSIENRSPFLSRDLLKIANEIPEHMLVRNGYAKSILRDAMKGIVPEKILTERRKVGFNSSLFEVADVKGKQVRELLLDDSAFYDHVSKERVEQFLDHDLSLNSDSKFLFNLINAKLFHDQME